MAEIGTDLTYAKKLLRESQLVSIPTETVYGLAANALDENAVVRIFEVKNRPSFDPLIVHIGSMLQLEQYVQDIPKKAFILAERYWPGPLTLVLQKAPNIPDIVTSGLDTVGVRVPDHPLTISLLNTLDFPLAAPSANPFGYISPTCANHVQDQLGKKIPYILDGGTCEVGIESTIIGFLGEKPTILRLGGLSLEAIESEIGRVEVQSGSDSSPMSPGMLQSHYAPLTKIELGNIRELLLDENVENTGILSFCTTFEEVNKQHQYLLSENGNIKEAATRLFAGLRYLDGLNLQKIICEPLPEHGLGRAINDRLKRASAQTE